MKKNNLLFLRQILLSLFFVCALKGISNAKDFENFKVFAGVTHTLYNDDFSELWENKIPIIILAETNYYYFDFTASVEFNQFKAKDSKNTNFFSSKVDLLFSYPIQIFNFGKLNLGVKTGNMFMFFNTKNIYTETESELFVAGNISAQTRPVKKIIAKISYEYGTVLTSRRIEFSRFFIALGYTFNTPRFIKEFLK